MGAAAANSRTTSPDSQETPNTQVLTPFVIAQVSTSHAEPFPREGSPITNDTLTVVDGLLVGHAQDEVGCTGCTAVLFPDAAQVAVDARGSAPGTYDTESLGATMAFTRKYAIFFAGRSIYGLDVVPGIRRFLEEKGWGWQSPLGFIAGVSGAILFDAIGTVTRRPTAETGYAAAQAAVSGPVAEGNAGAGMGATVGKFGDWRRRMKGGLGSSGVVLPNGLAIGALVVVNAVGNVIDPATGAVVAGVRDGQGGFVRWQDHVAQGMPPLTTARGTTIGLVATNADLSHKGVMKMAEVAHDGLARAVVPAHLTGDGDTFFAAATGKKKLAELEGPSWPEWPDKFSPNWIDVLSQLAAEHVARAVLRAVRAARGVHGVPAMGDAGA